jgi:hypothetical protein
MQPMKTNSALILFAAILARCSSVPADEYQVLRKGLVQSSIQVNDVHLPDLVYSIDEQTARRYFEKYFAAEPYSGALRVNLNYAVFHWGNNHASLQRAISAVFLQELEDFFAGKNKDAIDRVMAGDKQLHNHHYFMLCFLVDLLASDKIDSAKRQEIAERLFGIIKASRLCQPRYHHLPTARYPIINLLKAQLLLTSFSYADGCDKLDTFKSLMNARGTRKLLLERHGLLVIDNAHFDEPQLKALLTYLDAIPSFLQRPIAVTCYDQLHGELPGGPPVSVHEGTSSLPLFNVFAMRIGTSSGNQFPADYRPVRTDDFMIVFAHEHNHSVDADYVKQTPALNAYRERLLERAGDASVNYLRSMFNDGFFQQSPQEFFASIANMYFCSSEDTLLYALQKARAGNYNPLNQFLLIASVYGDNESCLFYRIAPNGHTSVERYPVRKTDGIISAMTYRGKEMRFMSEEGFVTEVSMP